MEEARAIELHRAEKALIEDDPDDEAAHAVMVEERLRRLKSAVDDPERELASQRASRART
jgi:hypothetical protein